MPPIYIKVVLQKYRDKNIQRNGKVQIFTHKMNKFLGSNVQHNDYS